MINNMKQLLEKLENILEINVKVNLNLIKPTAKYDDLYKNIYVDKINKTTFAVISQDFDGRFEASIIFNRKLENAIDFDLGDRNNSNIKDLIKELDELPFFKSLKDAKMALEKIISDNYILILDENYKEDDFKEKYFHIKKLIKECGIPKYKTQSLKYGIRDIVEGGIMLSPTPSLGIITAKFSNGQFSKGKMEKVWMERFITKLKVNGYNFTKNNKKNEITIKIGELK